MNITCLETRSSKKGSYVVIYNMESWPDRTLKHRGWDKCAIVFQRPATSDEVKELSDSKRYMAFRYQSWDELVFEEEKYAIDANKCAAFKFVTDINQVRFIPSDAVNS